MLHLQESAHLSLPFLADRKSESPRAHKFAGKPVVNRRSCGEKTVFPFLLFLPFFLVSSSFPLPCDRFTKRLRERRVAHKGIYATSFFLFPLSFPFFFLPNSCTNVNNRVPQEGDADVVHLSFESAGNAQRPMTSWRRNVLSKRIVSQCKLMCNIANHKIRICDVSIAAVFTFK